jgi:acetyl esterase/lipase
MARPRFFRRRWVWRTISVIVTLGVVAALAFALNPWPGAMLIRVVFERGANEVKAEIAPYAPGGVASITGEQYRPGDGDALLDVYFPDTTAEGAALPTLVWIHGGGWVSGHRDDTVPYLETIAAQGFTVVSLDYSLAPEKQYPTPLHQVNDALAFVQAEAERLHVDVDRILIGGSSAGAQIASQVVTAISSPDYAATLGITPNLQPAQLRGVVLHSGYYDLNAFVDEGEAPPASLLGWGVMTIVWAYAGDRSPDSATLAEMSALGNATAEFPPAFISGGNGDPLTDAQSVPFAAALQQLGAPVTTLFFPADHEPKLGHEYQYLLGTAAAQTAMSEMIAFMKQQVA